MATPITGTITVPNNVAFVGTTRMRVSMKYYSAAGSVPPTSCEVFQYGQVEDYTVNIIAPTTIITTKLFIQGYYNAVSNNMLPVSFNQGVGVSSTDVDSVTLELRNASPPYALAATTSAMLQTSGLVTGTFSPAITGSYYLVIKHRNALQTWSASPITVSASTPTYDFSNAATKAYGSNMKLMEAGVWAFYSGDLNLDEAIDGSDFPIIFDDIESSAFGFLATDLNGDGSTDNSDLPSISDNSDNSIFSVHP